MNANEVRAKRLSEDAQTFSVIDVSHSRRSHSIIRRILLNDVSIVDSTRILDVGCADGMLNKLIGRKGAVTGIEFNPILAAEARKVYKEVLELDLDKGRLPIADGTFDIIVAADVVEHCKYDEELLSEMHRILSCKGKLVISLPNIAQFIFRFKLLMGDFDYEKAGVLCRGICVFTP